MKKVIATAALQLLVPVLASAQNADHQYRAEGYIFIGVGSGTDNPSFEHVGGGGEARLFKGLGVGGELGAIGRPGEGEGVFSIGPSTSDVTDRRSTPLLRADTRAPSTGTCLLEPTDS